MTEDPVVILLIAFLTTPASDFYLSKLIGQSISPRLEPLQAGDIDLGSQRILGTRLDMSLRNVSLSGLSSIQIARSGAQTEITVEGNRVSFTALHPNTEAPPPGISPMLTLRGDFIASMAGTPLSGQFEVTLADLAVQGTFRVSCSDGQVSGVTVSFESLNLNLPATPSNVKITVSLASSFTPSLNKLLNSADIIGKIVDAIKAALTAPAILAALSAAATEGARATFAESPLG